MKMKRLISLAIVLLLVCGMPVSAFAENNVEEGQNLDCNEGTVETNNGTVKVNEGIVKTNFGTVETNADSGVVGEFYVDSETGEFSVSTSCGNFGTVSINEGTVAQNGGYLTVSDGNGGYTSTYYDDAVVETNAAEGLVIFNNKDNSIGDNKGTVMFNNGTVDENSGEVEVNRGTVKNNSGEVEYNYGTVVNEKGGMLYEYTGEDNQLLSTITAAGTYYGIIFDEGWVYEDDQYTTQWDGTLLLQRQDGDTVNLAMLFQRDGYEVTGYFLKKYVGYYYDYSSGYISSTLYTVSEDSNLSAVQLIWGKIKAAISSSSEPEAAAADIPTAVSAEYVKVGTTVQAKGQIFKVIEMDDGSITVVTLIKLSEEDKDDLMAYLGKYLTPQQLELLLSEPELVSTELADELFGGDTNHVVFKAAKNLFEK